MPRPATWRIPRAALAAIPLLAVALAAGPACTLTAKLTCAPGDRIACDCESEVQGYATCDAEGAGYGACDCSGARPWLPGGAAAPDGSAPPSGDGGTSALIADGEPCETNEQCVGGVCALFNNKGGNRCTRACTIPTSAQDCPPPFTGCNNKGVCKVP